MATKVVETGADPARTGSLARTSASSTVSDTVASLQWLVDVLAGPCHVIGGTHGEVLDLAADVRQFLQDAVLAHMAGPADDELSTQEAAKLLGVSRPTLIRMLDAKDIPFRATRGNHRRVSRRALMEHLQKDLERRRKALDDLGASADEFGFFDA